MSELFWPQERTHQNIYKHISSMDNDLS